MQNNKFNIKNCKIAMQSGKKVEYFVKMNTKEEKMLREDKTNILLCDAMIGLVEERDFDDIKVVDICERALVHKTTFYNHFKDKYELLNYIIKKIFDNINSKTPSKLDLAEHCIAIAKEYMICIKGNAKFYQSILKDKNGCGIVLLERLFCDSLERKIDELKLPCPMPKKYISKFFASAVLEVVNEWTTSGMKETESQLISYIKMLVGER